jgi:hypothetical protein
MTQRQPPGPSGPPGPVPARPVPPGGPQSSPNPQNPQPIQPGAYQGGPWRPEMGPPPGRPGGPGGPPVGGVGTRPRPPGRQFTLPVRVTVHLPDGSESAPIDLLPGTPIPQKGDTLSLFDAATGNEQIAVRVTERTLTYFPTPAGPSACEVLLYTESA